MSLLRTLRSPSAIFLILFIGVSVLLPVLPLHDPLRMAVMERLAPPSLAHPLGQDNFGRDVLSRLLWGGRISLLIALASASLAAVVGITLGLLAGYRRGAAEALALRVSDIVQGFPPLLMALLVVTILPPGPLTLIIVLSAVFVPEFTRLTFAGTSVVATQDYVEATRALGASSPRILLRTILPNVAQPLFVQFGLTAGATIVLESGLSFLGLGVVPPAPSWGLMVAESRNLVSQAPQLLLFPCLALIATIWSINDLCDRFRGTGGATGAAARRLQPVAPAVAVPAAPDLALQIRDLTLVAADAEGGPLPLVTGLDLDLAPGRTLALVGESGSGKSLSSLAVMGLLPAGVARQSGSVALAGRELTALPEAELRKLRGARMSMIFQNPGSALNPFRTIGAQLSAVIRAHRPAVSPAQARAESLALLASVGIPDPAGRLRGYPHEFSGGQKQRIMIAMALANGPDLLLADEPTTALDVTIQAQVLQVLHRMQQERGVAMLLISHSLAVVRLMSAEVAVMYAGEIVETGPTAEVFADPRHPYTRALLACTPDIDGPLPQPIGGSIPAPALRSAPGCRFRERCPLAQPVCADVHPLLIPGTEQRKTRCHLIP